MPTPPSTENYIIGKGKLYIDEWTGATPPASVTTPIGNCTSIEVEPTIERLPHYSSQAGLKTKDKNPIVQTEYMINFDCDEIAAANLKIFLMGTQSGDVISALQGSNKEYAIKFVSDNPIGPNQTWEFWKVTLTPNGALQLIGEEWMVMSFAGEGLSDVANHASSPYFTVTEATTTTTTTTT